MTLSAALQDPILDKVTHRKKSKKASYLNEVIKDFWVCLVSRETSVQGRREVLTGKAKFGIFGDGKEVPQVALAKAFKKGDYRSGYYRDQTWMMALGVSTVQDFLGQLYGDVQNDPWSGGRQMTGHFATPFVDSEGNWIDHSREYNISAGVSCTGGQMGRALGLALASKIYRNLEPLESFSKFSRKGNEVCFCSIGDASTSEGVFWETINAAAVMKVPLVIVVWDDGYGISVPVDKQTVKGSISRALEGFLRDEDGRGIELYTVNGYDYPSLCVTFEKAAKKSRKKHIPSLVHVKNLTQPQGHSTSGSHERYKPKERLQWEKEFDCLSKMEEWIISNGILTEDQTQDMRREARKFVREAKQEAWDNFQSRNEYARTQLVTVYDSIDPADLSDQINALKSDLEILVHPTRSEVLQNARRLKYNLHIHEAPASRMLEKFISSYSIKLQEEYSSYLFSQNAKSALTVPIVPAGYSDSSLLLNGFQIINSFFDKAFAKYPNLIAFGEDVGKIGDVNQGMAGLQEKYGENRIFDVGIREWTIVGQGLGTAMRGLRPIAEIQYLDYLVYALPLLTDDLATLRYRSKNLQQSPAIIRTRGHRLEGIWHTGSPMGMMLNSLKGIHLLVPRNMVQAAGMYNTLLQANDPAIVVECLNGYRLKEKLPDNIGEYTVPLGIPEVLRKGNHVTVVTYGSCVRITMQAARICDDLGISVELIDVQTLMPFDLEKVIVSSLRNTNKIIFIDEDVPGGASAFMMQKVLEEQDGFEFLDASPVTLTAKDHRTPYGNDGDYYAKPQIEDIVEAIYELVYETPMD